MSQKPAIVITSINPPTEAVQRFAAMQDFDVVMVGDKKTPTGWECGGVEYLSPETQETLAYSLIEHIPWNLPARANIGYLHAMAKGAPYIVQCDDDNIPNEHWNIPSFAGTFVTLGGAAFVNIYTYFTKEFVWPRGFPLNRILEKPTVAESQLSARVGIWQHLADKDTDVDAIYRLTKDAHIFFDQKDPHVLAPGTVCPFNCQSTTFTKDVYPLLYLPSTISPRASDIVRGLIAQPLLWEYGYSLGFTAPTVRQERNPHNYLRDFKDEVLIYLHSEDIVDIAKASIVHGLSMSENLVNIFEVLVTKDLVPAAELVAVRAWISDVAALTQ